MLAAPKDEIMAMIKSTARFGDKYAFSKYDAIYAAAEDAAMFGRALKSNAVRSGCTSVPTRNTRSIWMTY